jgi:hypothetical protein
LKHTEAEHAEPEAACLSRGDLDALVAKSVRRSKKQQPISNYKLHKAGSSTISAIIYRYAARHGRKILSANHESNVWPADGSVGSGGKFNLESQPPIQEINDLVAQHQAPKRLESFWRIVLDLQSKCFSYCTKAPKPEKNKFCATG